MPLSLYEAQFVELNRQAQRIEAANQHREGEYISGKFVDEHDLLNWQVKARNLLIAVCGDKSATLQSFNEAGQSGYTTNHSSLRRQMAVMQAAHEQYGAGMFAGPRKIIQAELFTDELEQAASLHEVGYVLAAAVIAGVVLETSLRQMCNDAGLAPGKLDKMNADLAKAGKYNAFTQKRVTQLAHIRNSAAHGKPADYNADDVKRMIADVADIIDRFG